MKLRVLHSESSVRELRLRMPFRYGIATMTEVPHLLLRLAVEFDGQTTHGLAADNLPPKWFTKNPATSFRDEIAEMREVIRTACTHAETIGAAGSVFEFWQELCEAQARSAAERGWPPLLAGFGVSLVERAVLDAFCRMRGITFARAVRDNALGVRLAEIHPELAGQPADYLPPQPLDEVIARHTVGLTDPLTPAEIPAEDRANDGLPQALEDCIRAYGLTHFKIKLSGDLERDRARLHQLAALLGREAPGCAFTLDGNENYRAVAPFRAFWEQLLGDPALAHFLDGLIFVEQPLHRDVALSAETATGLLAWKERPPIIIDESEGDLHALATALASGYAGTSHKNCKGVFRGIANACLIAHRRHLDPGSALHLSGEDLTNLGPVALLQDLAVVATLGIKHVERNGHHYFRGLSEFPVAVQLAVLAAHGDLYRAHADGYPVVRIEQGKMSTRSVVAAPFGYAMSDVKPT
ncbi:MAG: hypothetical protein QOE70_4133 [Chthoniobacter sp.]|jgi:hypothetical protein|nr:hypothetical protein [Chthoniobacter sp.]